MRVLVVSHMYPHSVNPMSGIFVHNQVKALKETGIEIHVISPIPFFPLYPKWRGYRKLPDQMEWDGVPVFYVPTLMFPGGFLFSTYGDWYFRSLKKALSAIKEKFSFDLIHCHTIFPDGYAGYKLKEWLKVPVISTIHGSDILLYPKRNRLVYDRTVAALIQNDQVITVSERLRREALAMVPESRIQTIYNGFNPARFYPVDAQEARERVNIPVTGKKLLFVGNLLPVKGVNHLLTAFAEVTRRQADLHLYVVGDGPLRSSLEKQAAELGINQQVTFMGRRPYEEIPLWINSADVVVLSSLSEGLPSILLESMGCGRPMVATDVGGISEILQHGKTGYLAEAKNPGQLAAYLTELLILHPEQTIQMGKQAYQASQQFTWQQNALQTKKLYTQVLERKSL